MSFPIFLIFKSLLSLKKAYFSSRSCRGGTSFLCRQRKDAKRAQRGESCFPPFETPYKVAAAGRLRKLGKYAGSGERLRPLKSPAYRKVTAYPICSCQIQKEPANNFYTVKQRTPSDKKSILSKNSCFPNKKKAERG